MSSLHPISPYAPAGVDLEELTHRISRPALRRHPGRNYFFALGLASFFFLLLFYAIGYLLLTGVGIWGVNQPVAWGFAIINLVWWIGIGHAGTLISAVLFLVRQDWRMSISRFAEAMTLFALACAGLFPLLHLGRLWKFYYILPYPNVMDMWPQFRSPLVWDVFAISTYALVSLLFWYTGLVPDLATLRDRAERGFARRVYGMLALGWRNSARHWHQHQKAYLLLAGLATPLVVSVHSVVSFDFAVGIIPGWHTSIFPPYFVAGAIYCGFAMVLVLLIPIRAIYGFKPYITDNHLDVMAKVMLASGLVVAYGYAMEIFISFYGGHYFENAMTLNRMQGPYAPAFWSMIACNVVIPQLLWFRWVRRSAVALLAVALVINTGMWLERYVIVITSLHRDYLPSSWGMFFPTFWDWATYLGTLGLFFTLVLIFIRVLPMISMSEMRELVLHAQEAHAGSRGDEETAGITSAGDLPAHPASTSDHEEASRLASGEADKTLVHEDAGPKGDAAGDPHAGEVYGLLVELPGPVELEHAVERVREAGYTRYDAYAPCPIPQLSRAMALRPGWLPLIVALCALAGAIAGYGMQYWMSAVDYPLNVGGRPLNSWPMFIPVTFECAILFGSLGAVFGMFAINGLPRLHHPLFGASRFERASQDAFFLCIEAHDPRFHDAETCTLLREIGGEVKVVRDV